MKLYSVRITTEDDKHIYSGIVYYAVAESIGQAYKKALSYAHEKANTSMVDEDGSLKDKPEYVVRAIELISELIIL